MTKFLNISTDTTLGGASPSDEIVSSQKALKTYIDNNSGGGGLPSQTGHAGEFLTTNGTDASWSNKVLVNGTNYASSVAIVGSAGVSSISIGQYAYTANYGVAVGNNAIAKKDYDVVIGCSASTQLGGGSNTVIGYGARVALSAKNAIQISAGLTNGSYAKNTTSNTFMVANANGNYEMMSADGTIPEARLADTTNAAQGQVLTLDSNLNAVWAASGGGSSYTAGDGIDITSDVISVSDLDCGTLS